ncbi:CcmD family protein [Algoriphagus sp. A40]|uniref:CcmD family protein n=1 Tax=Algoriphagus sp. A40 TaxID=1945863 RepID=UPI0009876130|nr:CcmD family protein [Algoriphagus sp. A40]OOG74309.1 CcmD family protein [Algoriphagus sp. A40]
MKKILPIALSLFSFVALAQEKIPVTTSDYTNSSVDMADMMRSNGKIYIVVGIIVIIFIGITAYLVFTDRKLSRIEKSISS